MKTTLYYKQGSSDKVYSASIEPAGDLFVVNFAYGRRGSTLTAGTKTAQPVPLAKAEQVFNKLVAEKRGKGYTEGEDGTPYVGASVEERATGIIPQLLTEASEEEAIAMLADNEWGMQEKFDGKRITVDVAGGVVRGINRKGLECGLPDTIINAAATIYAQAGDFRIDGEALGDKYPTFDCLRIGGRDLTSEAYVLRRYAFAEGVRDLPAAIPVAQLWVTAEEKAEAFARIKAQSKEGVVFKRLFAPYTPGKPASGGDQRKFCFLSITSVVVAALNQRRSFRMRTFVNGAWVEIGNCTVPPNKAIPTVGQIVDVRYKYAFPGGSLYQPFFAAQRDDIDVADVQRQSPLKYKPQTEESED